MYDTENVYIQSSNHRSNEKALETGGELIKSKWLDRDARNHLEDIGVLSKASEAFPVDYGSAKHFEPNEQMKEFESIVKKIALHTLGKDIAVEFITSPDITDSAWYGNEGVTFNISLLGKKFFNGFGVKQIELSIHELSHDKHDSTDGFAHLSHEYVDETIRIGAMIGSKGIDWYKHWDGRL